MKQPKKVHKFNGKNFVLSIQTDFNVTDLYMESVVKKFKILDKLDTAIESHKGIVTWTAGEIEELKWRYCKGESVMSIANRLEKPVANIEYRIKKIGLRKPQGGLFKNVKKA